MENKIKVLHLIESLRLGGGEKNLFNLISHMDPAAVSHHVAYGWGGEFEKSFNDLNVKLFKISKKARRLRDITGLCNIYKMITYIIKNKIDIVHTHTINMQIWGSIAARLTGRKIIEHVHDHRYVSPDECRKAHYIGRHYYYMKYFLKLSDAVIVLTDGNIECLRRNNYYPDRKIKKILNGIPVENFQKPDEDKKKILKKDFGLSPDSKVILTHCRISPGKSIDLIMRIAPRLCREHADIVFLIAGDGPLYEEFVKECKERKMDACIKFIGFHPDSRKLLSLADIYLFPSLLELHSLSILEAMGMGLPVLISKDVGSNNDCITNWQDGVLLNPFSDDVWIEAISRLLHDDALLKKMGRAAHDTCLKNFNIVDTAKTIVDLYKEISNFKFKI